MSLPMKVAAGSGSRMDLGLMRKPLELKCDTVVCKWEDKTSGQVEKNEMSSRYWMV